MNEWNGGREPPPGPRGYPGNRSLSSGEHGCDWLRKQDGGKSLIKQIISCWGREQLHFSSFPPPPSLGRLEEPCWIFMRLRAHSSLHRGRESCGLRTDRQLIYLFIYTNRKATVLRFRLCAVVHQNCTYFFYFYFCRVRAEFEGVRWKLGLRLGFVTRELDKSSRYQESRCPPLTCQDVPARGGPLLHLHPPHTHEVLLLVRLTLVFSNCFFFLNWSGGNVDYTDVKISIVKYRFQNTQSMISMF